VAVSVLMHSILWWTVGPAALLIALILPIRWALSDHLINRAFRDAAEGDFDAAAQRLKTAAAEDDPHGRRHEALGFLYFQRARWTEAAEAFAQAATRNPRRLLLIVYQAHSLSRGGKPDEAKEMLAKMATNLPEDVTPLCGMAILLADCGEVAAAAEYYWKARQLLAKHPAIQSADGMGLMEACAETVGRSAVPDGSTQPQPA